MLTPEPCRIKVKSQNKHRNKNGNRSNNGKKWPRKRSAKTFNTPSSFHMVWTLTAPLHAFTTINMARIVNGLPTSIAKRHEAIRRYNLPVVARAAQSADDYLATRFMRPTPPGPCWFQQLHDQIQANLFIEMRIRWAFRRLAHRFRIRRIDRKEPSRIDPITFCPIVMPMTVYDMELKRKFLFDARPLVKHVTHSLFQHDYLIPSPKLPINVYTNRPFTYAQFLTITSQVIQNGIPSGHLLPFKEYQFDLQRWKTFMAPQLLIAAIKEEIFNHQSLDGRELLIDFMIDRLRDLHILIFPEFESLMSDAIEWFPAHPVVQMLRNLCIRSYEADILNIRIKPLLLHILHSFYLKEFRSSGLWKLTHERRLSLANPQ